MEKKMEREDYLLSEFTAAELNAVLAVGRTMYPKIETTEIGSILGSAIQKLEIARKNRLRLANLAKKKADRISVEDLPDLALFYRLCSSL